MLYQPTTQLTKQLSNQKYYQHTSCSQSGFKVLSCLWRCFSVQSCLQIYFIFQNSVMLTEMFQNSFMLMKVSVLSWLQRCFKALPCSKRSLKFCHAFRDVPKFHNVYRDVSKLCFFQSSIMSSEMFQSSIMFTKMFQSSVLFMEMFESSIMLTKMFLFTLQTENALATQGPQLRFLQKAIQHVQHVWQQHTLHIQANMNCNSNLHQLQQYRKTHGCCFKNILLWLYMSESAETEQFLPHDQTIQWWFHQQQKHVCCIPRPFPWKIHEVRSQR